MEIVLEFGTFWKPLLAVVLSFLVARVTNWVISGKWPVSWNGGMPSVHSASVVGLFMTVIIVDGFGLLALMAGVFACVVINDALGARWETSKHSKFLNDLTKTKRFHVVGHQPIEALVGAAIGFLVPVLVYAFL